MERTERSIFLNNQNIGQFAQIAAINGSVGIDTEFERTHSYFPRLSIIQFSLGAKETYIYDFLDQSTDPSQIISILESPAILKIVHAGRQDAEAIHYALGATIYPLADTQIMAEELSFGKQMGYAALVKKFFGIMVEKELTRSNWMHRPLGKEEVMYATIDSYYLIDLYGQMRTVMSDQQFDRMMLRAKNMVDESISSKTPTQAWGSFRRFLASTKYDFSKGEEIVKALFLFREYMARKRNVLPNMIMEDVKMAMLSTIDDPTAKNVEDIMRLPPYVNADGIVAIIRRAKERSSSKTNRTTNAQVKRQAE